MVTGTVEGLEELTAALSDWNRPMILGTASPRLVAELLTGPPTRRPDRILIETTTFEHLIEVAYLRWVLAEHIEIGDLEIYVADDGVPLLATDETTVMGLIEIDAFHGGVLSEDDALSILATEHLENATATAQPVNSFGKTLSTVEAAFAKQFSPSAASDYFECLARLWPMNLEGLGYDARSVAVIVAANEEAWFSSLGPWGRETDIATEADFSRAKRQLEDDGIVHVLTQPQGVGRPRHQLQLIDEALEQSVRQDIKDIAMVLQG